MVDTASLFGRWQNCKADTSEGGHEWTIDRAPGVTPSDENEDWDRTVSLDEAQQTRQRPIRMISAAPRRPKAASRRVVKVTAVGEEDQGAGGTPYTEGYVTGGVHHPTIADLPPNREDGRRRYVAVYLVCRVNPGEALRVGRARRMSEHCLDQGRDDTL